MRSPLRTSSSNLLRRRVISCSCSATTARGHAAMNARVASRLSASTSSSPITGSDSGRSTTGSAINANPPPNASFMYLGTRASNMRQYASRRMRGRSTKRRVARRNLLNISNRALYLVAVGAEGTAAVRAGSRVHSFVEEFAMRVEPRARSGGVAGRHRSLDHRVADGRLHPAHPWTGATPGDGHQLVAAQRVAHRGHRHPLVEPRHAFLELVELGERREGGGSRVGPGEGEEPFP